MGGVSARVAVVDGQFTPAVKRMMTAEIISPKQWGLQHALVPVVCSAYNSRTVHNLLHIITSVLGYKPSGSITDSWQTNHLAVSLIVGSITD